MDRILVTLVLALCAFSSPARAAEQNTAAPGHYLFVWAGDRAHKGNDFLAVIDANPASASYGRLMTSIVTDQQTVRVHHTEYTMPASGMLFANDHDIGRTFIFDVRDALHPKIVTSFTDLAATCTRIPTCGCRTATCWRPFSTRITTRAATAHGQVGWTGRD